MSSGFNGINQFGNLTIQNGIKLKFTDFDKDGDGQISSEEYNKVLEEIKLDSVELSSTDENNKIINEENFSISEKKLEMQAAVYDMTAKISTDFSGKFSSYIPQITSELKDFINEFYNNYTGNPTNMLEAFKEKLTEKYEEIKANIFANAPTAIVNNIKSYVLDSIYENLTTTTMNINGEVLNEAINENAAYSILTLLEAEADNFIKNYSGNNLAADLESHLNLYMNKTEVEKMEVATAEYQKSIENLGTYIDSNEFKNLKNITKDFLMTALANGVSIQLGGTNIKTEVAINSALNKFSDARSLKEAMQNIINSLSNLSLKEQIIAAQNKADEEAANKAFLDIEGFEYRVNPNEINYSIVSGYTKNSRFKKSKNTDDIKSQARSILENNNLKSQIKNQIETMLKEAGIAFDKISNVFENVYSNSINQTLDSMTFNKTGFLWWKKYKSNENIKDVVDNFIKNFNNNITETVDNMNASTKDFDLMNIDYTAAGKFLNKVPIKDKATGKDLSLLYSTGETISTKRRGANYYKDVAEKMIDNLKSQFFTMANNFCEANGVNFDSEFFNAAFDNAKTIGVDAGVSGKNRNNWWIFSKPSESSLNTRVVIDTFSENFKNSYNVWLEKELAELT